MNRSGKAGVIILILLLGVSLTFGAYAFMSYQKERQQRTALEERIDDLELMKKKAEDRLEQAKQQLSSLTKDIDALKTENLDLQKSLEAEARAKEDALNLSAVLKKESEQQKTTLIELQNKLASKEKEVADIQSKLKELQTAKEELEKSQAQASVSGSGVNLEKIVVAPAGTESKTAGAADSKPKGPLQGKVLVVNKEYKFAVINLGKNDGINMDDIFTVSRLGKKLGQLQVEKVHDTMSAANFLDAKLMDVIKEDDVVIKK